MLRDLTRLAPPHPVPNTTMRGFPVGFGVATKGSCGETVAWPWGACRHIDSSDWSSSLLLPIVKSKTREPDKMIQGEIHMHQPQRGRPAGMYASKTQASERPKSVRRSTGQAWSGDFCPSSTYRHCHSRFCTDSARELDASALRATTHCCLPFRAQNGGHSSLPVASTTGPRIESRCA